jgi:dihydrofolate reductase
MDNRNVILYIAASLDGFIAAPDDDLSFLSLVEQDGEDYGYAEFIKTVDTVVLGRKTYDWVMKHVTEFPHHDKETYVITHTPKPGFEMLTFYSGNLKDLLAELKRKPGQNIFIDGGAQIVNELLMYHLIDELIISVIPILLGKGVRLFNEGRSEQRLDLVNSTQFKTGLVQLHYKSTSTTNAKA